MSICLVYLSKAFSESHSDKSNTKIIILEFLKYIGKRAKNLSCPAVSHISYLKLPLSNLMKLTPTVHSVLHKNVSFLIRLTRDVLPVVLLPIKVVFIFI